LSTKYKVIPVLRLAAHQRNLRKKLVYGIDVLLMSKNPQI